MLTLWRSRKGIFLLTGEQRFHTRDFKVQLDLGFQTLLQLFQRYVRAFGGIHGRSDSREQMRILGNYGMLVIQLQSPDEGCTKFRKEVERAAQEGDMSTNGLAAGQAGNRLINNCLENGYCKVLLSGPVIDQRLYVSFSKHAAACGNGINRFVVLRIFVEADGICLQK